MFKIQGKIKAIFDTQQITEKFKKREFVIEVQSGMYPEYIKMQLVQDRTALIDGFKPGQVAEVSFNLRGRPYNKGGETIYFTNLEAWRIEAVQAADEEGAPPAGQQGNPSRSSSQGSASSGKDVTGMSFSEEEEDDLPF